MVGVPVADTGSTESNLIRAMEQQGMINEYSSYSSSSSSRIVAEDAIDIEIKTLLEIAEMQDSNSLVDLKPSFPRILPLPLPLPLLFLFLFLFLSLSTTHTDTAGHERTHRLVSLATARCVVGLVIQQTRVLCCPSLFLTGSEGGVTYYLPCPSQRPSQFLIYIIYNIIHSNMNNNNRK